MAVVRTSPRCVQCVPALMWKDERKPPEEQLSSSSTSATTCTRWSTIPRMAAGASMTVV
jgi:hypothetical protein